jgi:hypothetical protein
VNVTYTLQLLNNDTWNVQQLNSGWFSNQLPQLTSNYSNTNTKFDLMSINGHFSSFDAIPANSAGGTLFAERIYTPTSAFTTSPFFVTPNDSAGTALIYTVGCHSGLNVPDTSITGRTNTRYQADWIDAILKQGGNLIGNTGYGYGDTDSIAYSEKLALLFTEAIGRNEITKTVGNSLTLAKRRFVETSGPGSFSAFDEKAMLEWTLYGLPGLSVVVPKSFDLSNPPYGSPIDPAPRSIPANQQNGALTQTRIITVTTTFTRPNGNSGVPSAIGQIQDSYRAGETITVRGIDQARMGRPVLPALAYDITLNPTTNGSPINASGGAPQPRGIRMLSAVAQPLISGFDPHVTTLVTEETFLDQQQDPDISLLGEWMPDQPYVYERVSRTNGGIDQFRDLLTITPTQFRTFSGRTGDLRLFNQMVFEVTYLDPRNATNTQVNDEIAPIIDSVIITQSSGPNVRNAARTLKVVVDASDGSNTGNLDVGMTYSVDGDSWQRQPLTFNPATGRYELNFTPGGNGPFIAIVEARDAVGNVTTETSKGEFVGFHDLYLPLVAR